MPSSTLCYLECAPCTRSSCHDSTHVIQVHHAVVAALESSSFVFLCPPRNGFHRTYILSVLQRRCFFSLLNATRPYHNECQDRRRIERPKVARGAIFPPD